MRRIRLEEGLLHDRGRQRDLAPQIAQRRRPHDGVVRPAALRDLGREVTVPASVVEEAFLEANPKLTADGVTVTCRSGRVQEVRVCLSRDLAPRACAPDTRRDCTQTDALLSPVR